MRGWQWIMKGRIQWLKVSYTFMYNSDILIQGIILMMEIKNFAIFALLLVASASISCDDGYYSASGINTIDNEDICVQCMNYFSTCTAAAVGELDSDVIEGFKDSDLFCGTNYYWNGEKSYCEIECKEGCSTCAVDYDYCTACSNGYVWNGDYTCLPSVVGLLAATLVILIVGAVAVVIAFVKVNGAAK